MRRPVTAADVVLEDGASRLLRVRGGGRGPAVLLVPSMLQRWYILDLIEGASLAGAMIDENLQVFVLDWGALGEERWLDWDHAVGRLARALRRLTRTPGVERAALVGYSQGATLAAVAAALDPDRVSALVDIAGPIDFGVAGVLSPLTDRRLCDADLLADAGGVPAGAFRAMIAALHPGATALSTLSAFAHPDVRTRAVFAALERWADDPVQLPPEVLRVWVKRLYQDNALVARRLSVSGRKVELGRITAPTLVVTAERDTICPPESATALLAHVSARTREHFSVPGGHVSGVAGPASGELLHRPLARWLHEHAHTAAAPSAYQEER